MEAIIFIGLLAFTWLFVTGSAPVQFIKVQLKVDDESKTTNVILMTIRELVNCCLCFGFWVGFCYYWYNGYENWLLLACILSISAELWSKALRALMG